MKSTKGSTHSTTFKVKAFSPTQLPSELETFTDKVFESSTTPLVFDFEYLENMEVISNYEEKWVKYRSLGSNYKIVISNPNLRSFWNFDENLLQNT